MFDDSLKLNSHQKKFSKTSKNSEALLNINFRFDGYNTDIISAYHWLLNFPYYTGKGYTPLKLEDYHYFSENSQFGAGIRQVKGNSIRAFQENLAQLIQLIKIHIIPLLKEVKQADFYKQWFDKIVDNDELIQEEIKKNGEIESNKEKLNKWRGERNEAINHLKDKWSSEVDGGKMWQMNRSSAEQGLDFTLLPQLFFGTNLDDPFQKRRTLKEQLDDDIYSIDISLGAKEAVARFMYRFYTWLPTAIKETRITYRLKISALKQFYTQLQMYIGFMKPLLIEISKKTEGFEKNNLYHNFDTENPEFANLFDFSYSFIRILGIRNFAKPQRGKWDLEDLNFSQFGFFLPGKGELPFGKFKGKTGFITKDLGETYEFYPCENKNISKEEFKKIKKVELDKKDLKTFPIQEFEFSQRRRGEIQQTSQGPQHNPFVMNKITFNGFAWNIFEIASYRDKLKEDNLDLLESFIEEIKVIKEDLLYYINDLEGDVDENETKKTDKEKNSKKKSGDYTLITGPFLAISEIISSFIPSNSGNKGQASLSENKEREKQRLIVKLSVAEDLWKCYSIYKIANGYMTY